MRLAILQNLVAPTRHALFEALARIPDIDLTVLFMARTEATRGWREAPPPYPHRFLRGAHVPLPARGDVDTLHVNPGIVTALARGRYDALLIAGFLSPTSWLALGASRALDTSSLLWFGTPWPSDGPRSRLAGPLKRALVRSADGVVAYGHAARAQAIALGASPERTFIALNTTDTAPFAAAAARRDEARAALALGERPTALWSGRFVSRKRPDLAVSLLARLGERVPGLEVLFVGDGSERAATEEAARRSGLRARFLGDRAYADLPAIYAACDLLVIRSEREPWGLVVNEALAAGVPVLASSEVTAAAELIRTEEDGLVADDEDLLLEAGVRLLTSARPRREGPPPEIAPAQWAESVVAAARAVRGRGR
jgi:glycosyltransferase involved in cell wall biosynthesis